MDSVRLFVAVDVPGPERQRAAAVGRQLARYGADRVNWVAEENLHLTVKFLGEVGEKQAELVREARQAVASGIAPFSVHLGSLGAFPRWDAPRVVFISLAQGEDKLVRTAARVEQALVRLGFPPEGRPLRAHLTLGRIREGRLPPPVPLEQLTPFPVDHLTLYHSLLTPRGSVYRAVERFPLSGYV